MKARPAALALLTLAPGFLLAQQSAESVMEKRIREFHRVIGLNDKEAWKNFIKENYTQALIDKPTKASKSGDAGNEVIRPASSDNIENKAAVFRMLHDDFGGSEITSLTLKGNQAELSLLAVSGLVGTFRFTFEKAGPYKIDALAAEAGN
jgi:hypothetical protein